MVTVIALHSFTHGGKSHSRNTEWPTSAADAEALRRAGLVRIKGGSKPAMDSKPPAKKPAAKKAAGAPKSAAKKPADPKPGQLTA